MEKPQVNGWITKMNLFEVSEFSGSLIKACERGLPLSDEPSRLPTTYDPRNLIVGHSEVWRTVVEAKLCAVLHHLPESINTPKNGNQSVRDGNYRGTGSESIGRAPPLRHAPAGAAAGIEDRHRHAARGEERRAHGARNCDRGMRKKPKARSRASVRKRIVQERRAR